MNPGLLSFLSKLAEDLIPGGKADHMTDSDFSPNQRKKGLKVELEHTSNRQLAKEIARDHLAEDPKYYSKLELIHKEAALQAQPKHQEFLDEHFSVSPRWKDFRNKLKSKAFVSAVKQDTRSDDKLKRYSEANGKHLRARGVPTFPVPSQSSSKSYAVKYHPDDGRYSCNCGDWVHARSHQTAKRNQDCKHIWLVKHELKMSGTDVESMTKKAAFVRAIERLKEVPPPAGQAFW